MSTPRTHDGIRLVSDRLVLREFASTDEDAVHSFAGDPLVTRTGASLTLTATDTGQCIFTVCTNQGWNVTLLASSFAYSGPLEDVKLKRP